jgi:hypothetical protein
MSAEICGKKFPLDSGSFHAGMTVMGITAKSLLRQLFKFVKVVIPFQKGGTLLKSAQMVLCLLLQPKGLQSNKLTDRLSKKWIPAKSMPE